MPKKFQVTFRDELYSAMEGLMKERLYSDGQTSEFLASLIRSELIRNKARKQGSPGDNPDDISSLSGS